MEGQNDAVDCQYGRVNARQLISLMKVPVVKRATNYKSLPLLVSLCLSPPTLSISLPLSVPS